MKKQPFLLITCIIVFLLSGIQSAYTQNTMPLMVEQVAIPVVKITDQEQIQFFLSEFMIIEDEVQALDVIDATSNGFGEDDLIKLYPSNKIYFPVPSEAAQKVMNSWEFRANFRIDAENKPAGVYENVTTNKAPNAIFASIIRGIDYNYKDLPIKVRLERDSSGVTFEMWGYNENKVEYNPPPPAMPDSVVAYDVLHVVQSDTVIIPRSQDLDLLYVVKTIQDTVFMPPPVSDQ